MHFPVSKIKRKHIFNGFEGYSEAYSIDGRKEMGRCSSEEDGGQLKIRGWRVVCTSLTLRRGNKFKLA